MLLWSWQLQLFCRTGQIRGNGVAGYRQLAIGLRLGGVQGPLQRQHISYKFYEGGYTVIGPMARKWCQPLICTAEVKV